jgi:acyl-coenzyme A synthetase/AMP-(fatty) acid ligase/acyl carrier protein
MFLALLNGATLCPLDLKDGALVNLCGWLTEQRITVYSCVTTVYRQSVQDLPDSRKLPDVRLIHVGGEPVLLTDVQLYKKHFSDDCLFVVRYSISETPAVSYYFIDKKSVLAGDRVPVGYPLEGNTIAIVDEHGQSPGPNEIGEIAVKSPFLSAGYWHEPELTRARFLSDSDHADARRYLTGDIGYLMPDGCLVHMGRKDFLVKIRGFRVETGEVESALRALQEIKQAVVVVGADGTGEKRLVAYVVPERDSLVTPMALRRRLNEKLPDYMVPQTFVMLNELPLTANGKIDRNALPDPGTSRPQLETPYEAPGTAVEMSLVKIWADVLNLSTVGIRDDFVALGGHSLLAARIVAKINEVFGIEVSIRSLLDVSTVAGLAGLVNALIESKKNAERIAGRAAIDEESGEL